jgi:hypothetical protein
MKTDEGEHGHDDHNQADQIDDAVHSLLPNDEIAQLLRHLNGETRAFTAEISSRHQYCRANKNHEHGAHENAQNAGCAATTISHDRLPKTRTCAQARPVGNAFASVRFLRPRSGAGVYEGTTRKTLSASRPALGA